MPVILDDTSIPGNADIEIVNPAGRRTLTHVIHDIDGTHSLIRDWPPVMSLVIHWAMNSGLNDDFDSDENLRELIQQVGKEPLEEINRFCVESAGLSALTQMEFGIRRGIQLGNIPEIPGLTLTPELTKNNEVIIERIWEGEERFDDIAEPPELIAFINERTPRLFMLYEKVLNEACRDRNTALAWKHPEKFLVPGSLEFITYLHSIGLKNYFVTGSVIYEDGGMAEEVEALGFKVGPDKMIEHLIGSSWDRKLPKDEVIADLFKELGVDPSQTLVIGDGRREIMAGTNMGCVTMSRLPVDAPRLRELHIEIGTNYIVNDYTDPVLMKMIHKE
ncbi:HAD family hydrolase [Planctomycetota bacterium]